MFDIGFTELLVIGIVGLIVVGPEQLPGAVRTVIVWVNRCRQSFDQIRSEVRRELHNDEVMQKLKAGSRELEQEIRNTSVQLEEELEISDWQNDEPAIEKPATMGNNKVTKRKGGN